jgi:hypothetical protein
MSYGKMKLDKTMQINQNAEVKCYYQKTSYGFRHVAEYHNNYRLVATAKATYYNRTWESYEYESVLIKLKDKIKDNKLLPENEIIELEQFIKDPQRPIDDWNSSPLKAIGMIAKLGDIMTDNQSESNSFKKRMLNTQPGIDFPDDFDNLPEEERSRRLNKALEILK